MEYVLKTLAVLGAAVAVMIAVHKSNGWRCPGCRRRVVEDFTPVAFCPRCGALRSWGDGMRHPVQFESRQDVPPAARPRVRAILEADGLDDALPRGTFPIARIVAAVPAGIAVEDAHPTWLPAGVGQARGFQPFPRQPASALVPAEVYRVEIDCVDRDRPTGGMSTQFGFEGVFVSLLVSLDSGRIWDARADRAY